MAEMIETSTVPAPAARTEPTVAGQESAQRVFSRSMFISATRCLLTYLVFPFVAPLIGWGADVGPIIGIVIGVVAIVANVFSIRRFWGSDHPWKIPVSALNVAIIG
jgi:hypothetical protein